MGSRKNIPVLIDFDGVIRLGNKLASDAYDFLLFLHKEKISYFIISNSTRYSSVELKKILHDNGIGFEINAMTTVDAAIEYLEERNLHVSVYCPENIRDKFEKYIDDKNPEAVVIGDLGEEWSYEILNEIFRKVYNGAEIIAMQMNKSWMPDGKNLSLDAGAFISAIEYATGKKSFLIGKPSPVYFQTALQKLGYKKDSLFFMIGDDLENDIYAAQKIGGKGILVFTGKTKFPFPPGSKFLPDYQTLNLSEVENILKKILR